MPPIVRIDDLTKNYFLESVTVRACAASPCSSSKAISSLSWGRPARANRRCSICSAASTAPPTGDYYLGEEDVSSMDDDQLSEIRSRYLGFIFQSYNLLAAVHGGGEHRSAAACIRAAALTTKTRSAAFSWPRWSAWAIGSIIGPMQFSGGQQQRVAIARALVNDPHVILADEPTGNLDSQNQRRDHELLIRLNRAGKTIIMVTHENDIAAWARRVVRMRDGQIESDDRNETPKVGQEVTSAFVASLNSLLSESIR